MWHFVIAVRVCERVCQILCSARLRIGILWRQSEPSRVCEKAAIRMREQRETTLVNVAS